MTLQRLFHIRWIKRLDIAILLTCTLLLSRMDSTLLRQGLSSLAPDCPHALRLISATTVLSEDPYSTWRSRRHIIAALKDQDVSNFAARAVVSDRPIVPGSVHSGPVWRATTRDNVPETPENQKASVRSLTLNEYRKLTARPAHFLGDVQENAKSRSDIVGASSNKAETMDSASSLYPRNTLSFPSPNSFDQSSVNLAVPDVTSSVLDELMLLTRPLLSDISTLNSTTDPAAIPLVPLDLPTKLESPSRLEHVDNTSVLSLPLNEATSSSGLLTQTSADRILPSSSQVNVSKTELGPPSPNSSDTFSGQKSSSGTSENQQTGQTNRLVGKVEPGQTPAPEAVSDSGQDINQLIKDNKTLVVSPSSLLNIVRQMTMMQLQSMLPNLTSFSAIPNALRKGVSATPVEDATSHLPSDLSKSSSLSDQAILSVPHAPATGIPSLDLALNRPRAATTSASSNQTPLHTISGQAVESSPNEKTNDTSATDQTPSHSPSGGNATIFLTNNASTQGPTFANASSLLVPNEYSVNSPENTASHQLPLLDQQLLAALPILYSSRPEDDVKVTKTKSSRPSTARARKKAATKYNIEETKPWNAEPLQEAWGPSQNQQLRMNDAGVVEKKQQIPGTIDLVKYIASQNALAKRRLASSDVPVGDTMAYSGTQMIQSNQDWRERSR